MTAEALAAAEAAATLAKAAFKARVTVKAVATTATDALKVAMKAARSTFFFRPILQEKRCGSGLPLRETSRNEAYGDSSRSSGGGGRGSGNGSGCGRGWGSGDGGGSGSGSGRVDDSSNRGDSGPA